MCDQVKEQYVTFGAGGGGGGRSSATVNGGYAKATVNVQNTWDKDPWRGPISQLQGAATNRREAREEDRHREAFERKQEHAEAEHRNLSIQTELGITALMPGLAGGIKMLSAQINRWMSHQGFWTSRNVGEKLALMHSEISEAMEADRKGLHSDHIAGFTGVEEEMADVVIRVLDFCHENDLRLAEAIEAKMRFNLSRPHMHGKKY